jgi:dihydrofolate synthase/folylpolyglutamate synthase
VEIAILEIGLGGRFDAVNIVSPILSVITDIDLDHRKWLGDTLSKIAFEKAGIVKPGKPVVVSIRQANALNEIRRIAEERSSRLHDSLKSIRVDSRHVKKEELPQGKKKNIGALRLRMETKIESLNIKSKSGEYDNIIPFLSGEHQRRNIKAVIQAAEIAREQGYDLSNESVIRGIERTDWPGRLEWFDWNGCPVLFDGAHNPAGIRALVKFLKINLQGKKFDLVFAVKKKKNYINVIKSLFPMPQSIWLIDMGKKGFIEPEKLRTRAGTLAKKTEIAQVVDDFIQSYSLSAGSEFLLCTGSLHLIGNLKAGIQYPNM